MIVTFTCVVFIYFQLSSVYLFIFVTSLYLLLLFKTALKIKLLQYGCFFNYFLWQWYRGVWYSNLASHTFSSSRALRSLDQRLLVVPRTLMRGATTVVEAFSTVSTMHGLHWFFKKKKKNTTTENHQKLWVTTCFTTYLIQQLHEILQPKNPATSAVTRPTEASSQFSV